MAVDGWAVTYGTARRGLGGLRLTAHPSTASVSILLYCYLIVRCSAVLIWRSVSGSDNDGCVYVFQWKIFVIIASHLTNFEKCGIKYVNI